MLKVQTGYVSSRKMASYDKTNEGYLIPISQAQFLQQIVNQIVYQKFGHDKSQTVNLIQRIIKSFLSLEISIPVFSLLFEKIKQQETYIKQIRKYLLACQNILQSQHRLDKLQNQSQANLQVPNIAQFNQNDFKQAKFQNAGHYFSQTCEFGSPTNSQQDQIDQDFWNSCDRYLQIDSTKHENLDRFTMSQKKAKLRIQGLVSSFNFNCPIIKPKKGEQEIRSWTKNIKKSILNQKTLQQAAMDFVPYGINQNYENEMRYRNKIKSTKLKNRLSKNIL